MIDTTIESLARDLCDTYYLTVDPDNIMLDAFAKITEKTRDHWRAHAELLLKRGWVNDDRSRRSTRKVARSGTKSRW